jgi:hypothetical protein
MLEILMAIKKEIRDEIIAQALSEIAFARRYKQGKITNWQKNENMYYGKKQTSTEARANVDLGRMQEFVHTLLSKIDNPLVFKFTKRKEAQLQRVQRLNALREIDQQNGDWDIKDLAGKKQAIIYGRAIYSYYADSPDGVYQSHLSNIDVYDFLIDPSAGGLDIEKADFLGDYGVVLSRSDIEKGRKDGIYLKTESTELLSGVGNNTEMTQEETNKNNRMYGQDTVGQKELVQKDKFKFWRWFTTYNGERYYLLLQEQSGRAIRVEKLTDLFSPTKSIPQGAWPYWTWAAFPDLTEFWTPSYCDYVREMFMAQNASINQMLDNAEAINKPMKLVNVSAIENLAELKYRRDGVIKTKGDYDASRAMQIIAPPSIDTPIKVFDILELIHEKAMGVSANEKGVAEEDGKVAIYEGNRETSADRFGLLNKSYAFGYKRFAKLYEIGVRDNLTKKIAIDIIGPDGIETENVSRKDIFRKNDDFAVLVEASNAEQMSSSKTQEAKIAFLMRHAANPMSPQNPKKAYEIDAKISGFEDDQIKELMDKSEFGASALMAEAARDIEAIMEGEQIEPNAAANNAYKQKFVDYMMNHQEHMTDDQFMNLSTYVRALDEIIAKNEARALNSHMIKTMEQASVNGMMLNPNNPPVEEAIMNNGNQVQGQI